MPVYRGIKISVISQHGAQALPEYSPARIFDHHSLSPAPDNQPALLDSDTCTATVYIPIFPNSVFWFRYHVYVPNDNSYFYFKAFINGSHFVSWGSGEAESYRGKTMFGIFESSKGESNLERRLFAFSDDISLDVHGCSLPGEESVEIRVYRSSGRYLVSEPVPTFVDTYSSTGLEENTKKYRNVLGFRLGGDVDQVFPTSRYQYVLKDPIDAPFVTFRWLPRTWQELDQLDVISLESESLSSPSINTGRASKHELELNSHTSDNLNLSDNRLEKRQSPICDHALEKFPTEQSNRRRESKSFTHSRASHTGTSKCQSLQRDSILEPRNEFDRIAVAQPANRRTLLDSVMSQSVVPQTAFPFASSVSMHSTELPHEILQLPPEQNNIPDGDIPTSQALETKPAASKCREAYIESAEVGMSGEESLNIKDSILSRLQPDSPPSGRLSHPSSLPDRTSLGSLVTKIETEASESPSEAVSLNKKQTTQFQPISESKTTSVKVPDTDGEDIYSSNADRSDESEAKLALPEVLLSQNLAPTVKSTLLSSQKAHDNLSLSERPFRSRLRNRFTFHHSKIPKVPDENGASWSLPMNNENEATPGWKRAFIGRGHSSLHILPKQARAPIKQGPASTQHAA